MNDEAIEKLLREWARQAADDFGAIEERVPRHSALQSGLRSFIPDDATAAVVPAGDEQAPVGAKWLTRQVVAVDEAAVYRLRAMRLADGPLAVAARRVPLSELKYAQVTEAYRAGEREPPAITREWRFGDFALKTEDIPGSPSRSDASIVAEKIAASLGWRLTPST